MRHPTVSREKPLLVKLEQLQTELVELAVTLERRGHLDAADVALTTSARLAELTTEAQGPALATVE